MKQGTGHVKPHTTVVHSLEHGGPVGRDTGTLPGEPRWHPGPALTVG